MHVFLIIVILIKVVLNSRKCYTFGINSTFEKSDIPAIQKDSLSELFSESGKASYFYVKNTLGKHIIDNLIKDSKGNIASYIELQKDLAGMFSLVRKGLIKKFNYLTESI